MYCSHCGKEIGIGAKYCTECGQVVSVATEDTNVEKPSSVITDSISSQTIKHRKLSLRSRCMIGGVIVSLIIAAAILILGDNMETKVNIDESRTVIKEIEKILENDLGTSVHINKLYYNEVKRASLVEFETSITIDIAAVYFNDGKILYDSDFDYYQQKFQSATNSSERGKWSSKVLEYSELIEWQFGVSVNGLPEKDGWKKIK